MITQIIRQQIVQARSNPQGIALLRQRLQQMSTQGAPADDAAFAEFTDLVNRYISETPDLLEACDAAATQAGIGPLVGPILQTAAQYFVTPLDFVPDHFGLFGLLDDAYLSRSLIENVSALFKQHTGVPLLPFELGGPNRIVRVIIGEPLASQLDQAVSNTIQGAIMQQQVQALAAQQQPLAFNQGATGGPGSWGGSWEDEMSRTAAELGISINW